jgi:hypothetical protein
MGTKIKSTAFFFALFYLTLYLPVMTVAYSSFWYRINCKFHGRCDIVGKEKAVLGISELTSFFRHGKENLEEPFWTVKEKSHLSEVKGMFDVLSLICVPAFVLFFLCYDEKRMKQFSLVNIALVISLLLLILPFFKFFWGRIFHPLLFTNKNWLNTPLDFSYYIMPRVFFRNTVVYLVFAAVLINLAVYLGLKLPAQVEKNRAAR